MLCRWQSLSQSICGACFMCAVCPICGYLPSTVQFVSLVHEFQTFECCTSLSRILYAMRYACRTELWLEVTKKKQVRIQTRACSATSYRMHYNFVRCKAFVSKCASITAHTNDNCVQNNWRFNIECTILNPYLAVRLCIATSIHWKRSRAWCIENQYRQNRNCVFQAGDRKREANVNTAGRLWATVWVCWVRVVADEIVWLIGMYAVVLTATDGTLFVHRRWWFNVFYSCTAAVTVLCATKIFVIFNHVNALEHREAGERVDKFNEERD